jgi:hypothetical protein
VASGLPAMTEKLGTSVDTAADGVPFTTWRKAVRRVHGPLADCWRLLERSTRSSPKALLRLPTPSRLPASRELPRLCALIERDFAYIHHMGA